MELLLWGLKQPTWASFSMNLPHNYNVITRPWLACQWLWLWWQIWCRLQNAPADGLSESYNWVNELHALICYSFIWAAWGMTTINLLHGLLYVWWVPWRVFLDNAARTSWRKTVLICEAAKKDFILSVPFFPLLVLLFFDEYLNIIVIYLSRLSVQLHRAISGGCPPGEEWGCAWLSDSGQRHV